MKTPKTLTVYVRLAESDEAFLTAFCELMARLEGADSALLEDAIAEAHAQVVATLQGLRIR